MRFQQGVDDRPTRLPISATESDASSCSTVKILRSMASIEIFFQLSAFATLYIEKYFRSRGKSLSRKSARPGPFSARMSGGGPPRPRLGVRMKALRLAFGKQRRHVRPHRHA